MNYLIMILFVVLSLKSEAQSGPRYQETGDQEVVRKCVFMELPGMIITSDHKILSDAKVRLLEGRNKFVSNSDDEHREPEMSKGGNFGIVFLNKKKERGLPVEKEKREALFRTLDSKMKADGITHWYIFQLRSTDYDLVGVYGPVLEFVTD